jgi:hypothetical protein
MRYAKAEKSVTVQVGQRIYRGLYGGSHGIVYAVHGEQSPASVRDLGGVVMGGRAEFDIVFDDGHLSRRLPECILRGVQWEIFDDIAGADEILDALAQSKVKAARDKENAEAEAERRAAEREQHKRDNPHLKVGGTAAENIRIELRRRFPGVKFSVRSSRSSVDVSWVDGPTVDAVREVTRRHKEGHFDGMQDLYETDLNATFAQVFGGEKYIDESRDYGDRENKLAAELAAEYKQPFDPARPWECQIHGDGVLSLARRILGRFDLTGAGPMRLARVDDVQAGRLEEFWTLEPAPEVAPDASLQYPDPAPATGPMVCLRKGRWLLSHEDGGADYPYSYSSRSQAEKRLAKLGDGWAIVQGSRLCFIARDESAKAAPVVPVAVVVSGPTARNVATAAAVDEFAEFSFL